MIGASRLNDFGNGKNDNSTYLIRFIYATYTLLIHSKGEQHRKRKPKTLHTQFVQRKGFWIVLHELYFLWQGTILIQSVDHLFSAVGDLQVGCALFETFFFASKPI